MHGSEDGLHLDRKCMVYMTILIAFLSNYLLQYNKAHLKEKPYNKLHSGCSGMWTVTEHQSHTRPTAVLLKNTAVSGFGC